MRSLGVLLLLLSSSSFAAPDAGPTSEKLKQHATSKDAADKINVQAVEEGCFPETLPKDAPAGVTIAAPKEKGKTVESNLIATGDFTKFAAWAKKFGNDKEFRTIAFGPDTFGGKDRGFIAWCLGGVGMLPKGQTGYVKDTQSVRLVWKGKWLEALRMGGNAIRRFAIVYDKTEVMAIVRGQDLLDNKAPEFTVVIANLKK